MSYGNPWVHRACGLQDCASRVIDKMSRLRLPALPTGVTGSHPEDSFGGYLCWKYRILGARALITFVTSFIVPFIYLENIFTLHARVQGYG